MKQRFIKEKNEILNFFQNDRKYNKIGKFYSSEAKKGH